ncbi:caspase, EACC1-associated type [Nocardia beijingensis]
MRLPNSETSRAVLVGTATYREDSGFLALDPVRRNLTALTHFLRSTTGLRYVETIENPRDADAILDVLEPASEAATDVLLFYYSGHGVAVGREDLGLTHCGSRSDRPGPSTLHYSDVRKTLLGGRAQITIVILDCCHSGRALGIGTLSAPEALSELTQVEGGYVVTATDTGTRWASSESDDGLTAFTSAMLATLTAGVEPGYEFITLASLFRGLSDRLIGQGKPRPRARGRDTAADIALALNPNHRPSGPEKKITATSRNTALVPFPDHTSGPGYGSEPARTGVGLGSSVTGGGLVPADRDVLLGRPLQLVTDPFALEVHRPITVHSPAAVDALPPYVRRAHDHALSQVVTMARDGHSAMAILVGGSSSGKTRALYEAMSPLRHDGGWRLWHPTTPTRREALEEIGRIGPRTILWLNETQEYLGTVEGGDERVAAALKQLRADTSRAPVLILGTLWPIHHATLTRKPGSQARVLLEDTVIEVPDAFTGADLDAMRSVARLDPRLALALDRAEDGQIIQYLAGGPELVARYRLSALPAAKAVIEAAIDARRMGCAAALPQRLLHHACHAYMSSRDWDALGEDWFAQALAETGRQGRGTRGPLTRIRPRPCSFPEDRQTVDPRDHISAREPTYQLADYLDQYGRAERADQVPPNGFWLAAASYADPQDLPHLAAAANSRGLYRHAAQLWKTATAQGDTQAAGSLLRLLHELHPGDSRPALYVSEHTSVTNAFAVATLIAELRGVGASDPAADLARRSVSSVTLDDAHGIVRLLEELHALDLPDVAKQLVQRIDTDAVFDDIFHMERLADALAQAGEATATREVSRQMSSTVARDDPFGDRLLDTLPPAAAAKIIRAYLNRDSSRFDRRDCFDLAWLVPLLPKRRGRAAVDRFLRNAVFAVDLDTTSMSLSVASLLDALRKFGAHEAVHLLARRTIEAIPTTVLNRNYWPEPDEDYEWYLVADLLEALERAGEIEVLGEVARRSARIVRTDFQHEIRAIVRALHLTGENDVLAELTRHLIDKPRELSVLIHTLWLLDDRVPETDVVHGVYKDLAVRAADGCSLDKSSDVAALMWVLRKIGETGPLRTLARRAAAATTIDRAFGAADLIDELAESDTPEALARFASRAADTAPLDRAAGIASLMEALTTVGKTDAVQRLARRAATAASIDSPREVEKLMDTLDSLGNSDAAATIARRALDNAVVAPWALLSLWRAGHPDLFHEMACQAASTTPVDDPVGAANMVDLLSSRGEADLLDQLIDRIAPTSPGVNPADLTILLEALHRADRPTAVARIARNVTHTSLDDATEIATLITTLHDANQPGARGELARRVAAGASVDDSFELNGILDALRNSGQHNEFDKLLRRAATEIDLDGLSASMLAETLWKQGATHELSRRLPAAGHFWKFLQLCEYPAQFRFGREPSGRGSDEWSWDDLL